MHRLSAVIPAYNEAENIEGTIREILQVLRDLACADGCEIIVVDDHSSDGTFDVVQRLAVPGVGCVRLSRRSGSHVALRAGLAHARGDVVLCVSADGQDNPQALRAMIETWQKGADVVWALRIERDEPFLQKAPALLFYRIIEALLVTEKKNVDMARADFYLLDRKVVDAVNSCPERHTSLFGLIEWLGFRQASVEYHRRERRAGKSKWRFGSRLNLAWNWIIAFSGLPLRLMTVAGITLAAIGFLYAVFLVTMAVCGRTVQGFATIVVLLVVLSGIQMSMLGVIGEYLWRNIEESRRRPMYFIERSATSQSGSGPIRDARSNQRRIGVEP